MFMLDRVADLVVLSAHPGVIFIAVSVESCKGLETFLRFAVVDEPSVISLMYGQSRSKGKSAYLGDSGNSMINNASTTAGIHWIPKLRRHCIESSSAKFSFVPKVVQDATSAPMPSMNCCSAVTLPRIEGCAISAWYSGIIITKKPTPIPAITRPAYKYLHILRCRLQRTAEEKDDGASKDGETTAEIVTSRASKGSTEEGAACEHGDHSTLLGFGGIEARFEIGRCDYACDDAEVITVEDGADGGEDRDQEL